MQLLTLVLAAAFAATASVCAQRVIPITFGRPPTESPGLVRREWAETLANNLTAGGYYAQVELGSPAQTVDLILDTGSSDVWVLDSQADLCTSAKLQRQHGGGCLNTYTSSKSSTYKLVGKDEFDIRYADGSAAEGDYFVDSFNIGGASIPSLQMGLARTTVINSGLLGVGFSSNEAADTPYPNVIDQLEAAGLIGIKAYSLYLNDLQAQTGTILLGGLDTEKYIGTLKAVPIQPDARSGKYNSFTITLSDMTIAFSNGSTQNVVSTALPVILDSGTTVSYLPSAVASKIWATFGAVDDTHIQSGGTGLVYVDCGYLTNEKSLTFDFQFGGSDGPLIKLPIDEMILDNMKQYIANGLELPNLPFVDVCTLGIQASSRNFYLLGDTFLRSAYVVYDLTNQQVAMAPSNFNSTKTNIIEIQSGATAIPLVSGVASQVMVQQTATGLPGEQGSGVRPTGTVATASNIPTVTVTAGAGSTTTSGTGSATSSSSSTGNAAPAGVPLPSLQGFAIVGLSSLLAMLGGALVVF